MLVQNRKKYWLHSVNCDVSTCSLKIMKKRAIDRHAHLNFLYHICTQRRRFKITEWTRKNPYKTAKRAKSKILIIFHVEVCICSSSLEKSKLPPIICTYFKTRGSFYTPLFKTSTMEHVRTFRRKTRNKNLLSLWGRENKNCPLKIWFLTAAMNYCISLISQGL